MDYLHRFVFINNRVCVSENPSGLGVFSWFGYSVIINFCLRVTAKNILLIRIRLSGQYNAPTMSLV